MPVGKKSKKMSGRMDHQGGRTGKKEGAEVSCQAQARHLNDHSARRI